MFLRPVFEPTLKGSAGDAENCILKAVYSLPVCVSITTTAHVS